MIGFLFVGQPSLRARLSVVVSPMLDIWLKCSADDVLDLSFSFSVLFVVCSVRVKACFFIVAGANITKFHDIGATFGDGICPHLCLLVLS